jgi:hypothetical protein
LVQGKEIKRSRITRSFITSGLNEVYRTVKSRMMRWVENAAWVDGNGMHIDYWSERKEGRKDEKKKGRK